MGDCILLEGSQAPPAYSNFCHATVWKVYRHFPLSVLTNTGSHQMDTKTDLTHQREYLPDLLLLLCLLLAVKELLGGHFSIDF